MTSAPLILLVLLRFVSFALALGLTLISFQAYRRNQTDRLKTAFVGFAFISMAMALSSISVQFDFFPILFQISKVSAFIIGFSMFYLSLYR